MIKLSKALQIFATWGLVQSKSQAYAILGLTEGATPEEIKKAYKAKALQNHPDLNPNSSQEDMKLLNAARDFLLESKEPELPIVEEEPEPEEVPIPEDNPFELSYEEISKMRDEMGRDEFEKKFPGWTGELMHEMGLDAYNKLFEKYDPEYSPMDDPYFVAQVDQAWDRLKDMGWEIASAIYEKGKEDNVVDLYTNVTDLMEKYPDLVRYPAWVERQGYLKDLNKIIADEFFSKIIEDIDEYPLSLEDVMDFPHPKYIESFLSREGNIENTTFPDSLLSSKEFTRGVLLALRSNVDALTPFFEKYADNPSFIEGLMKSVGFFHYVKDNPEARALLKYVVKFSPEQRKIVDRWLKS